MREMKGKVGEVGVRMYAEEIDHGDEHRVCYFLKLPIVFTPPGGGPVCLYVCVCVCVCVSVGLYRFAAQAVFFICTSWGLALTMLFLKKKRWDGNIFPRRPPNPYMVVMYTSWG